MILGLLMHIGALLLALACWPLSLAMWLTWKSPEVSR